MSPVTSASSTHWKSSGLLTTHVLPAWQHDGPWKPAPPHCWEAAAQHVASGAGLGVGLGAGLGAGAGGVGELTSGDPPDGQMPDDEPKQVSSSHNFRPSVGQLWWP